MTIFNIRDVSELVSDEKKWKNVQLIQANLEKIRKQISADIDPEKAIDRNKAVSLVLDLIDKASFRIGGETAETFGISTVKRDHVRFFDEGYAVFEYIGKKKQAQRQIITSPTTLKVLKDVHTFSSDNKCEDDRLFCFQDSKTGKFVAVTDNMVRKRLKELSGTENVHAFRARKANEIVIEQVLKERSSTYNQALEKVVKELGHFRTDKLGDQVSDIRGATAEKSYIHPALKSLKWRTGGFPNYREVTIESEKYLSRKQIISGLRDGSLNKEARKSFFV